ncbi:MAG: proline dehydrogenase family protein [Bacteroidia bacterium]|nr:proline dehydrogenase family protein [Bacteroidia bacterium]
MSKISFDNTEIAFKHKSDAELKQAKWLFSVFNYSFLVKYGPALTSVALKLRLPIKGLVKSTIFKQFCGGETIQECDDTADVLYQRGVGSILDYSVEGVEGEETFIQNAKEIKETILSAKREEKFPFAVFKCTGVGRFEIFEKASNNTLSEKESVEFETTKARLEDICKTAVENGVRLLIDAEETWIQDSIDEIAMAMMQKYNQREVWIYNTLQMYRVDRLEYLNKTLGIAKNLGFKLGYKLVRGAYMEKERARAEEKNYDSPIQPDKESTDRDFDRALTTCFEHREMVSTCLGTHNENSSKLLADLMTKEGVEVNDNRFWFAQLYGMSDNISFNLAQEGFNVAKYLPYGPIQAVLPYLGRRAQENSSVSGQVGREMSLIVSELKRRKA